MSRMKMFVRVGLCLAVSGGLAAAQTMLVFDRGLPAVNINNSAGANRSNVRWTWYDYGFVGDDFSLPAPGERWIVDRIRIWTVAGGKGQGLPTSLGDFYQDVRLYLGSAAGDLSPVASGRLNAGSNASSNSNITVTRVTDGPAAYFDDFGTYASIWQVDFDRLGVVVEGGTKYRFGAWGLGQPIPDREGHIYPWFTHASNRALSEARQDGADNLLLAFDASGRLVGSFDTKDQLWDKSSDLNVQVYAHLFAGVTTQGDSVTLYGNPGLDAAALDVAGLRFGGGEAAPLRSEVKDADGDGRLDLILFFRPGAVAGGGCLKGKRADGAPFTGCTAN